MSPDDNTQNCPRCKTVKPREDFHKNRSASSGLCIYCKPCNAEYRRELSKKPHVRHRLAASARAYQQSPRARESARQHTRRRKAKYPEKRKARSRVYAAVASGRLVRPATCGLCGNDPGRGVDGRTLIRADHHKGYAPEHWLDVRWICVGCDAAIEGKKRRKH